MITSRRAFLTGLGASFAAPAIVRATSLMPVKALPLDIMALVHARIDAVYAAIAADMAEHMYGNLVAVQRNPFTGLAACPAQFYERSVSIGLDRKTALTIPKT